LSKEFWEEGPGESGSWMQQHPRLVFGVLVGVIVLIVWVSW
jgi:hypothetical protein